MDGDRPAGRITLSRRGFVLVTMIVSLVALLAFLGLAIDVGYEEYVKTRMQTAADAAALGGAQELRASGSANLATAAKGDSAANGFTDGVNSVSVTVNNPPVSGYSTSDPTAVEVILSQRVPTFFMELLGFASGTVQARAVARLGSGTNCLYTLDPSAPSAFSASGGATVAFSCGVIVDSSSSTAMSVSGGARITANSVSVAGKASISGGATVSPSPVQGVTAQSDPLSYLTEPTAGGCNFTNTSVSGGATATLGPGVYCKGISISGGSKVTFTAGTYVLKGGLSVSGGSSISGNGVTFFNTSASGYSYQPISISGGASINLSAPTSGSLAGILFFQDPSVGSAAQSSISGGADAIMNGAFYFPTTGLAYSGGTSGQYTIIVARTVSFSGGSRLNSDYSSLPGGSPVKGGATLSE